MNGMVTSYNVHVVRACRPPGLLRSHPANMRMQARTTLQLTQ